MNLTKVHYQIVVFPIFLFLVVFILWASLMKIGEFVRGYGKVVPSGNVKQVQHLEGGIVAEILVQNGQKVRAGQPLYRISNEFAITSLEELNIALNARLAVEARLRSEMSGAEAVQFPAELIEKVPSIVENERNLFSQRKSHYNSAIEVLEQQLGQRRLQLQEEKSRARNLSIQYQYSKDQEEMIARLVKSGAASQRELIDSKLKAQNLKTDLEDVENRILTTEKSIQEAEARIVEAKNSKSVELQTEFSLNQIEIEKLKGQISANEDRVARTEIRSPVDGVVRALYYNTIGGIIRPGDTIADIIPSDEMLLVEARVVPQDRGRVWVGQDVNIKLTAYDASIYGGLKGQIIDISADTFLDEGTRMPYYLVKVESNVRGFGDKPIYPGMIAEVDLVSGERTVLTYLLKPLFKVFNAALSES